jgi:hypothetical protein
MEKLKKKKKKKKKKREKGYCIKIHSERIGIEERSDSNNEIHPGICEFARAEIVRGSSHGARPSKS